MEKKKSKEINRFELKESQPNQNKHLISLLKRSTTSKTRVNVVCLYADSCRTRHNEDDDSVF